MSAGTVTGLLVGLTGVGGALMTPLLLLVFGVAPLAAVGADLWLAAITKLFAPRVDHGHGLSIGRSSSVCGWAASRYPSPPWCG